MSLHRNGYVKRKSIQSYVTYTLYFITLYTAYYSPSKYRNINGNENGKIVSLNLSEYVSGVLCSNVNANINIFIHQIRLVFVYVYLDAIKLAKTHENHKIQQNYNTDRHHITLRSYHI